MELVLKERKRAHVPLEIRNAVELLGDEWVFDGHIARVVVKCRSGEQNDERAHDRGDGVHPEEEPIQHHGDKAPILILLLLKQKESQTGSVKEGGQKMR